MITLTDLTRQYIKMYEVVRQYIWPYATVEDLANLEVAIYNRFPDIGDVKSKFDKFYRDIQLECKDDEELDSAVNALKEVIYSDDSMYSPLSKVNEVYEYEDSKV